MLRRRCSDLSEVGNLEFTGQTRFQPLQKSAINAGLQIGLVIVFRVPFLGQNDGLIVFSQELLDVLVPLVLPCDSKTIV